MTHKLTTYLMLLWALFGSCHSYSQVNKPSTKTYLIGSYYIPGLVNTNGTGTFVDIFEAIKKQTGLALKLQIRPTLRTQREFRDGQLVGYFPELFEGLPLPADQLLLSEPFWRKPVHLFYRRGEAEITHWQDLEGKRVALVRGYTYGKSITANRKIRLNYVDSDIQSLKMLLFNRVDYILGDLHSTINAVEKLGFKGKVDYTDNPLFELDVYFVFQDNEEGEYLESRISEAIRTLKRSEFYDLLLQESTTIIPQNEHQ